MSSRTKSRMTRPHHLKNYFKIKNSVSMHHRNIQVLATEMLKADIENYDGGLPTEPTFV